MADTKKRFTLGNTTVNLGEIEKTGGLIGCRYNTYPYCANQITRYEITDIPQTCAYHTRTITVTGCHGVTLPRTTTWMIPTDRIRTAELTPQELTPQLRTVELTPQLRIEEIAGLKEQLKEDLQAVEAHEAVVRSAEVPQTMEEMNLVEEKLKDSLAEVQKLKEALGAQK